jgi:hypothetical protein
VGQFGLPNVIYCAGAAFEKGAEIDFLTLAHPFRWRLRNVGVGNRARFSSLTPAHPLRRRWKGSRKWLPNAGASISVVLKERQR